MSPTGPAAVALFTLKPGRTVEEYRRFSHEIVRPGMAEMPSVRGFMDYAVTGSMTEGDGGWQLVEIVRISSTAEFERDNQEMPGLRIAEAWNEWVDTAQVIYLQEL